MKTVIFFLLILPVIGIAQIPKVGIGTTAPATKLDIRGTVNIPSIPGNTSTGIFRIGVSPIEGIDIGKMGEPSYSGWIQSGFDGNAADPLSLQPIGGNVGIGTTSPLSCAALDVNSVTQGFLPPRMTYAQRNAISNPVAGLMVFCIDCDEVQVFNGTIWKNLSGRAGSPPSLPFVTICNEDWTLKNLNVSTYRNGDPIPNVTNSASWAALTTGAYCYYNNDSTTYAALYGKLYNWYAVNDPRGLAPEGWHIPNVVEITTLRECLGGQSVAGAKMKEAGISHWYFPNIGATNSSGFTGLPGGYRNYDGPFLNLGQFGYGWCSNNPFPNEAPAWVLYYFDSQLITSELDKNYGYSVRLIRD